MSSRVVFSSNVCVAILVGGFLRHQPFIFPFGWLELIFSICFYLIEWYSISLCLCLIGIDGKVKAAFTRAYNKEGHMTPYAAGQIKKGRAKEVSEEAYGDEEEDQQDADQDSEQDDDPTMDAMIKVKSKKTTAASGATKRKAATAATAAPAATRGRGGGSGSRGGRKKKTAE